VLFMSVPAACIDGSRNWNASFHAGPQLTLNVIYRLLEDGGIRQAGLHLRTG
jgi:hypothetical protein